MISEETIIQAKNFVFLNTELVTSKEEQLNLLNMELIINLCDEINQINLKLKYITNNIYCINNSINKIEELKEKKTKWKKEK